MSCENRIELVLGAGAWIDVVTDTAAAKTSPWIAARILKAPGEFRVTV